MGTINYLQAIKPDTAYLRKIINASLLFDWAIRIEYQHTEAAFPDWQLWADTFFALRSADRVIDALMQCYRNNPDCVIRLNAEKFRPQSSLLYTVYDPRYVAGEGEDKPQDNRAWLPHGQPSPEKRTGLRPAMDASSDSDSMIR